jgi:hypothetical protein
VPGATDPLQTARDRLGRLDLDDEVDRAHVDAELEGRRRNEGRNLAALQELLDLDALLAGQRAVVGPRDLPLSELVQAECQSLGEPAVVDEEDRRAVGLDEAQELRIDRWPDRVALTGLAHVLDRNDDAQVELLRPAGVDQLDLAASGDEAPDLVQRPLGRREADALERLGRESFQPLEAEGEMRAALRSGHGVHLVDDHEANRAQRFPRARGQQEEERFGGRDEDVRRVAEHRRALLRRGVPGADADGQLGADPSERPAEVPFDVVVQRFERADVEHLDALAWSGAVERPEEGGKRLA